MLLSRAHRRLGRCPSSLRAQLVALALASSGFLAPEAAFAQAPTAGARQAFELNERGSALYAAGDYRGALSAFESAYALVAEQNLLFNIAGCHERLGQRTQALEYYRWYLSAPGGNAEGRRRAIEALSRLEARPVESAPPPASAPAPEPVESTPVWPLVTLGSGILFAGLGAGLYLDGAHDHNEVTNAPGFGDSYGSSNLTEVEAQRLIDSGDTKKLVGALGFGLGSALIGTYVVVSLWRSGSHEAASNAELRLLPGGWAVAGKF